MDKKNTILLTIIAIATLLVAMVGATFAYFTAQRGQGAQADITVTTSTSDSVIYGTFNPLMIVATQQNFGQGLGSQRGTSQGTITLTSSDNANREDIADYCYTSTIKISENDFNYKPQSEDVVEPQPKIPELLLQIWKDTHEYSSEVINDMSYKTLEGTFKICDQENGINKEDGCSEDMQEIKGYDLTEFGKSATAGQEDPGTTVDIQIPLTSEEDDESKLPYVHHIKASSSAEETVSVMWKATITLVNHEFDQQYNTNKKFLAKWVFTPVDCDTGDPVATD